VSTPNTASSYINLINQNFPIAGQDNSSQGFRNNFTNIKQSLTWLDNDVYDLRLSSVKKTEDNDFNDNVIEKVTFKDCSIKVYDATDNVTTGDVIVDYENGSYQKFKLSEGYHIFTFINWPDTFKTGRMTVSLETESLAGCFVDFVSYQVNNLGPDVFPIELSGTTPKIFEVWNDGDSGTIFVQSTRNVDKASTLTLDITTLVLGGTNTFSTVTNLYAKFATSVKANGKAGNLALVPNKILGTVTSSPLPVIAGTNTSTSFKINDTTGILLNATFDLPNSTSTTKFNVVALTTTTINVSPAFEVTSLNVNDVITFVNPTFTDQPIMVSFKSSAQTTTTSAVNDLKGTIYANTTTLYVSHSDYSYNSTGWLKISADHVPKHLVAGSTAVTTTVTNDSTLIATTEFSRNLIDYVLPYGSIIMWHGTIANIPTGWALCDGTSGTPNLINRFVIGAGIDAYDVGFGATKAQTGITGTNTVIGGSTSTAVAGTHNHGSTTTSVSIVVPATGYTVNGVAVSNAQNGTLIAGSGITEIAEVLESINQVANDRTLSPHNHTISSDGAHSHSVLPPFYALCYIMKITGQ
jgi:hypothetical protein